MNTGDYKTTTTTNTPWDPNNHWIHIENAYPETEPTVTFTGPTSEEVEVLRVQVYALKDAVRVLFVMVFALAVALAFIR